jgi:hypothetical protein
MLHRGRVAPEADYRVEVAGWKVEITCPSESVHSRNGAWTPVPAGVRERGGRRLRQRQAHCAVDQTLVAHGDVASAGGCLPSPCLATF